MSEPIRYTGKTEGSVLGSPHWEHAEGEWVKYEDYARLKAEVERSRDQYNGIIDTQLAVIDSLKAEVERLTAFTTCTIIPNEILQAKVERLTKAGDAMADRLMYQGYPATVPAWNVAKEDKGQP